MRPLRWVLNHLFGTRPLTDRERFELARRAQILNGIERGTEWPVKW